MWHPKCDMWHNYKFSLLSLNMKTKVVQHVPRINISMSQTQTQSQSQPHWFPASVMLKIFLEKWILAILLVSISVPGYVMRGNTVFSQIFISSRSRSRPHNSPTAKIAKADTTFINPTEGTSPRVSHSLSCLRVVCLATILSRSPDSFIFLMWLTATQVLVFHNAP